MVWLLQRNEDLLLREIRQPFGSPEYEFEVALVGDPSETMRFGSATDLINGFLRRQTALQAQGWRPARRRRKRICCSAGSKEGISHSRRPRLENPQAIQAELTVAPRLLEQVSMNRQESRFCSGGAKR